MFFTFFENILNFFGNYYFLLVVQSFSFLFKTTLLYFFTQHCFTTKRISFSWYYLWAILFCSGLEDLAWIVSLLSKLYFPTLKLIASPFFVRIGWAANIVMYQLLSLFIESFIKTKKTYASWYQYLFLPLSSFFFFFFLCKALGFSPTIQPLERTLQEYQCMYSLLLLMPFTILLTLYSLRNIPVPRILHHQLKVVLQFFLLPHLIASLIQVYPFTFTFGTIASNASVVALSTMFLSLALFYCMRRIIGLRFLNIHSHVYAYDPSKFNFVTEFKTTLESLGKVTSTQEIKLIVQHFFNRGFGIPTSATCLSIRNLSSTSSTEAMLLEATEREIAIEHFMSGSDDTTPHLSDALAILKESKIFIRDEIEYNNYLEKAGTRETILTFLDAINADIFIPIYQDSLIIASISIERGARPHKKLYNNIERDEMLVFTSYLSKIIFLIQNRNLSELLKQRKEIMEELYVKHQEVNQYKESIRSFLRANKENTIGILFYKNRKFSFGNKEATQIIALNPNTQEGEPLTKLLHAIAQQVESYKTSQSAITKDAMGKKLIITALPHPEKNSVIFIVHYPDISDLVKRLIDYVKDPSDWDYLLYLETTQSGKLVNNLIPGTGETLLNFKIDLLKLALTKKAALLEMPEQDLEPTAELIHHISLREIFYTLDLKSPATGSDIALKLFGINPLFGSPTTQPLFERLDKKGTLFIKNVHFLDKETQEMLAEFIRYGFYNIHKSDKKIQADIRIICSAHQNLSNLVQKGSFSASLYHELCSSSLTLPSVMTLPKEEIETLVVGYSEQAIAGADIAQIKMFMLNDKDKERIIEEKPASLIDLKVRVQNLLINKTKKVESIKDSQFTPAHHSSDPKLLEAARLGKHALKDPKILSMLWEKFQNQNKIAQFLGVNRSSVNRRCKDYGIL